MSLFSQFRVLVFLRRIARALESLAASQATLAKLVQARESRIAERQARRRMPTRTSFETMDTAGIEANWQMQRKHDNVERG